MYFNVPRAAVYYRGPMPSYRVLPAKCPACLVDLNLVIEEHSEPLMMQTWTCPACTASNEAVFTWKIRRVTQPLPAPPPR